MLKYRLKLNFEWARERKGLTFKPVIADPDPDFLVIFGSEAQKKELF
jgi:hypothetical protein